MNAGETAAWNKLKQLSAREVAVRAGVEYHEHTGSFVLPVFGRPYRAATDECSITKMEDHHVHAEDLTHFGLLVPLYLASCAQAEPTGRLVAPESLPQGRAFFTGRHQLPTEVIAHHFGSSPDRFVETGQRIGGVPAAHGDAAIAIPAFPRVPVILVLWLGDLEFPARAQILLDETAPLHLPLDALWATLVMTSQAMIQLAGPHH